MLREDEFKRAAENAIVTAIAMNKLCLTGHREQRVCGTFGDTESDTNSICSNSHAASAAVDIVNQVGRTHD